MAKAVLSLTLVLSDIEADALWEMLDSCGAFNAPVSLERTMYAEHFGLTDVLEVLDSTAKGECTLNLTGQQLVKLKQALTACQERRYSFFVRSPLWAIQAEIENLPTHRIKE
jgi:hypothetical protein